MKYELIKADMGFALDQNKLTYSEAGSAMIKITLNEAEDSNYNSAATQIEIIVDYAEWEQDLIWNDHTYEEKDDDEQTIRTWADRQLKIQSAEARMIKWEDQWEPMTEEAESYVATVEAVEHTSTRYKE